MIANGLENDYKRIKKDFIIPSFMSPNILDLINNMKSHINRYMTITINSWPNIGCWIAIYENVING